MQLSLFFFHHEIMNRFLLNLHSVNTNKLRWKITNALPVVLLAVWYLFSIVGFDFHRDNEHGKVYVVSGIVFPDCESIHPFSHCHDGESEGECLMDESCCSDDFRSVTSPCECSKILQVLPATSIFSLVSFFQITVPAASGTPMAFSANSPPPDRSVLFLKLCVLRV